MMKAGVGADVIAGAVKSVRLSAPLTSEQIVEWKRAGILDPCDWRGGGKVR